MLDCARVGDVLSLILWWSGLALEIVILIRGLRTRAITKYPYFYLYILCVFGVSAGLYAAYRVSYTVYSRWYWPTEFATLVVGCGVILEILDRALEWYPGARRFLMGLCVAILVAVVGYAGWKVGLGALRSTAVSEAGMERDLRVVQAIFLATIMSVVFYYGIELGKNLKGLILGFGAYVGISVMILALLPALGSRFEILSERLRSGSYLFALLVWTVALWSYAPNPPARRSRGSGPDYDQFAGETREKLEGLRDYFGDPKRP
jgi:hypothetical protein